MVADKREMGGPRYHSVTIYLKYKDTGGNDVTGTIDGNCPGFERGAEVVIYYDKDDPKKIMVDPDTMYPNGAAAEIPFFIIGGLLIAGGIAVYKFGDRSAGL